MFLTITKGELSCIRSALEEHDPETRADALTIVNAIIDRNVTVDITSEDQMFHDPMDDALSEEEILDLEDTYHE